MEKDKYKIILMQLKALYYAMYNLEYGHVADITEYSDILNSIEKLFKKRGEEL